MQPAVAARLAAVAGAAALVCCVNGEAAAPAETQRTLVTFHGPTSEMSVSAEVRDTPGGRARGLMFRRSLGETEGMLFVFPRVEVQSFWMKNTYIPLDMIFIGEDLRVVGVVANAEPLTLESRAVDAPSKYVVETVGGFARRHGVVSGTRVTFDEMPARAPR